MAFEARVSSNLADRAPTARRTNRPSPRPWTACSRGFCGAAGPSSSEHAFSLDQPDDQHDHGDQEEEMDQRAGDVEDQKTQDPQDEQKYDDPEKHWCLLEPKART